MRGNVVSMLALVAGVVSAAAHNSTCARGLYLIVVRGTSELKGTGITGPLAKRVAAKVKDSTVVPLDYPATLTEPVYKDSEGDGVDALQEVIQTHVRSCPDSKVAIMGYSQGAQVAMDTLCGGTGDGFDKSKPLPADLVKKNIVAVVLFGDPSHVVDTSYDRGTSVKNGIFARSNATVGVCEKYSDRLVSFCDTGDVYCDSGEDKPVHSSYIERYGNDALKFVVDRYGHAAEQGGKNHTSSSTAAPTASSTGSVTASGGSSPTSTTGGTTSAASGLGGGSVYLGLTLAMAAAALQAL